RPRTVAVRLEQPRLLAAEPVEHLPPRGPKIVDVVDEPVELAAGSLVAAEERGDVHGRPSFSWVPKVLLVPRGGTSASTVSPPWRAARPTSAAGSRTGPRRAAPRR